MQHIEHIAPEHHRSFYNSQRFTLNVTRRAMIKAGYSPSVRLFEAAACATPIISDHWDGLEAFFQLGKDILIAHTRYDVMDYLQLPENQRREMGASARRQVLGAHTAAHRALALEAYWSEIVPPTQTVVATR